MHRNENQECENVHHRIAWRHMYNMPSCCNFAVFEEEVDELATPVDKAPFKREYQCVLNTVADEWATFQ